MGFSWKQAKLDAIQTKIRRAKTMAAKKNVNPDFALAHPEWVREAQSNNYTDLVKKVTQQIQKEQERAIARRNKYIGKT